MPIDPDPERTEHLQDSFGLREVEALAMQYAELGFSSSGIASLLDVTEATASKYLDTIDDEVGNDATQTISPSKPIRVGRLSTFPNREPV